jgi:hypothetical protein
VGDEREVTETGLFGRVKPLDAKDGLVRVTVDRNPKFIYPLPASLFGDAESAWLDGPIEALPGESTRVQLTLSNPTSEPARIRIGWLSTDGWRLSLPQDEWALKPQQRMAIPMTATAPRNLAIGDYQLHANVIRNDNHVSPLALRASVLPQVTLAEVGPRFEKGRPVLAGTLHRLDPRLETAPYNWPTIARAACPWSSQVGTKRALLSRWTTPLLIDWRICS